MDRSGAEIRVSGREVLTGTVLGLVFLTAFLVAPNIYNPNGDTLGWAYYLRQYASAEGPLLWADECNMPVVESDSAGNLSHRASAPGWWVLWNPHHLLYLPVTATFFRISHQALPELTAFEFLVFWNNVISAVFISMLYFLLVRLSPGNRYALPWTIFTATSVTFFMYATDGSQYMTPLLLLVLAAGSLLAWLDTADRKYLARSGVWFGISILFHQAAAIIAPFVILAVFLIGRNQSRKTKMSAWKFAAPMLVYAAGIPLVVYLAVGAIALGPSGEFTPAGIIRFATLYGGVREYWQFSFMEGFLVNLGTFVGFYFGNLRTGFLFLHSIPYTVFTSGLIGIWLTGFFNMKSMDERLRMWTGLMVSWILPLLVFFSFWTPGHEFYHLFLVVPLASLSVTGMVTLEKKVNYPIITGIIFWIWVILALIINIPVSLGGSVWQFDTILF